MYPSLGQVIWFSSKVTDGAPLNDLCDLVATCSLIGAPDAIAPGLSGYCHEEVTGQRWDYDERSFDEICPDQQAAILAVVNRFAEKGPTTILPFFAYRLTSRIALTTPNVRLLGNPPDLERMFDQKPWVEHELGRLGVRTVDWRHFHRSALPRLDHEYPIVVRPPSGTGGQGMYLVIDADGLRSLLASAEIPEMVSAARYLPGTRSVNVTGCVNADGTVVAHPISLQIIGASICTPRVFGYCGNDFGSAKRQLEPTHISIIDQYLRTVGRWMHGYGFRGAFGLDLLVKDSDVIVSELNPRFQGSSHLGSQLMRDAGLEDVYPQHIRSHLGVVAAERPPPLADVVAAQRDTAQIFCYANASAPKETSDSGDDALSAADDERVEFYPPDSTRLDAHALLFRYLTRAAVLDDGGRDLLSPVARRLLTLRSAVVARPLVGVTTGD